MKRIKRVIYQIIISILVLSQVVGTLNLNATESINHIDEETSTVVEVTNDIEIKNEETPQKMDAPRADEFSFTPIGTFETPAGHTVDQYGDPQTCELGVSKIYECFSDMQFSLAVQRIVGGNAVDNVLTEAMVSGVTELKYSDFASLYSVELADGTWRLPYADGLSIFTNIKTVTDVYPGVRQYSDLGDMEEWSYLPNLEVIQRISFMSMPVQSVGDIGAWGNITTLKKILSVDLSNLGLSDIGDLGNWGNLTNLEDITNVVFSLNELTDIGDLGKWRTLSKLTKIDLLSFRKNKLTNIGNLGQWSQMPSLTIINAIDFGENELTSIGDIGEWEDFLQLKELNWLLFEGNNLTSIGDISKWKSIVTLTVLQNIQFNDNKITAIGDLSAWKELPLLKKISGIYFNNNNLVTIGDLGDWSANQNLEEISSISFVGNQITSIGDLSKWGTLPSLKKIDYINFAKNNLTTVGDLGQWKNLASIEKINFVSFANNKLVSVGDLSGWGNLSGLTELSGIYLYDNELTTVGDISTWRHLTNTNFLTISLSDNNLTYAPMNDAGLTEFTQSGSYAIERQRVSAANHYVNKHGLSNGAQVTENVKIHNAFNVTPGHEGEYGTYTLTPTFEMFMTVDNIEVTPVDNKLPLQVSVGDQSASYVTYQNAEKSLRLSYHANVNVPLKWIDLSISAKDVNISLTELLASPINADKLIELSNAKVNLIDENNVATNPNVIVDQAELLAITNATIIGEYPLTYTYMYQGLPAQKTIMVKVTDSDESTENNETTDNNEETETNKPNNTKPLPTTGESVRETLIIASSLIFISLLVIIRRKK